MTATTASPALREAKRRLRGFWSDARESGWDAVRWDADDILRESRLPWLELRMPWRVPYDEMLEEARRLKSLMVRHRDSDYGARDGQGHRGWRSICFHGLSARQTEHCTMYGLTDAEAEPKYGWTEIAPLCPVTVEFFRDTMRYVKLHRVRFMLLEAGGFILPHVDVPTRSLGPVNMALNNPARCEFRARDFGVLPFRPRSAFRLDVGTMHAVWNRSVEDRYHIIVHGRPDPAVWEPIHRESLAAAVEERRRATRAPYDPWRFVDLARDLFLGPRA